MKKSEETITLYHSTDPTADEDIKRSHALFGFESLDRKSLKGVNLTSDKKVSQIFGTMWQETKTSHLITYHFKVPKNLIGSRAELPGFDCEEMSTNITVSADELPDSYLKRINMTRELAINNEQGGLMRFYKMPLEYLIFIEAYPIAEIKKKF